jgi:hypothetical protein
VLEHRSSVHLEAATMPSNRRCCEGCGKPLPAGWFLVFGIFVCRECGIGLLDILVGHYGGQAPR